MRLIDADAFEREMYDKIYQVLVERYGDYEAINGLHFSFRDVICNIDAQPTIEPDDGLGKWAKVVISVLAGILVWAAIMLTVETFRRWGIL